MRSNNEIQQQILDIATSDPRIKAVLLNGSRANDNVAPDPYQDFDLVFVVQELAPFLADHTWTDIFGKKILWQLPDEMSFGTEEAKDGFTYLMVFEDGHRIDLTLFPLDKLGLSFERDSLTKVWLDKEGHFGDIPPASEADYLVPRPSIKEFQDICNEFWWVCPYVAKALAREEIIHAKEIMEGPVRQMFHRILEIHVGVQTDFTVSLGKGLRFIQPYLSESEYEPILLTYPNHEKQNIRECLERMMALFSTYAQAAAQALTFSYNLEEEMGSKTVLHMILSV